jgi:hypothetical protein
MRLVLRIFSFENTDTQAVIRIVRILDFLLRKHTGHEVSTNDELCE